MRAGWTTCGPVVRPGPHRCRRRRSADPAYALAAARMIPLEYRLREPVRLEPGEAGAWQVVCEEPLAVLDSQRGGRPSAETDRDGATVSDIGAGLGLSEDRVLKLWSISAAAVARGPQAPRAVGAPSPRRVTVIIPYPRPGRRPRRCLQPSAASTIPPTGWK